MAILVRLFGVALCLSMCRSAATDATADAAAADAGGLVFGGVGATADIGGVDTSAMPGSVCGWPAVYDGGLFPPYTVRLAQRLLGIVLGDGNGPPPHKPLLNLCDRAVFTPRLPYV